MQGQRRLLVAMVVIPALVVLLQHSAGLRQPVLLVEQLAQALWLLLQVVLRLWSLMELLPLLLLNQLYSQEQQADQQPQAQVQAALMGGVLVGPAQPVLLLVAEMVVVQDPLLVVVD
ncbi:hypothetical protein GS682_04735 [Nostoc sp. B(2019)]|nr:hypothetical protein [Nostoc sp. B(2019)]